MSAASIMSQPTSPGTAMVGETAVATEDEEKRWQPVMTLPCDLSVDLELPGYKVSDLLKLGPGMILDSIWPVRKSVPLRVNGTVIGWGEFELAGEKLAVRVAGLA